MQGVEEAFCFTYFFVFFGLALDSGVKFGDQSKLSRTVSVLRSIIVFQKSSLASPHRSHLLVKFLIRSKLVLKRRNTC